MTGTFESWNPDTDPTPDLDDFLAAYEDDDNVWWRILCGDHMNLFDTAVDQLQDARARIAALEDERDQAHADAGAAIGQAAALDAHARELGAKVAARTPVQYAVAAYPGPGLLPGIEDVHTTRDAAEAAAAQRWAQGGGDYRVYELREVAP